MRYEGIAADVDVTLCSACGLGTELAHHHGFVEYGAYTVHWKRDRATRAGIYSFLKLCGAIKQGHSPRTARWRAIYEQSTYATWKARKMGIVIPASVIRIDRLQVRSMYTPNSSDPVYKWIHQERNS
jgi:hypothetical protein